MARSSVIGVRVADAERLAYEKSAAGLTVSDWLRSAGSELVRIEGMIEQLGLAVPRGDRTISDWLAQVLQVLVLDAGNLRSEREGCILVPVSAERREQFERAARAEGSAVHEWLCDLGRREVAPPRAMAAAPHADLEEQPTRGKLTGAQLAASIPGLSVGFRNDNLPPAVDAEVEHQRLRATWLKRMDDVRELEDQNTAREQMRKWTGGKMPPAAEKDKAGWLARNVGEPKE